jgi:hypothetical protein
MPTVGSGTQGDLCVCPNGMICVYLLSGTTIYGYLYDEDFTLINNFTTNVTDAADAQFSIAAATIANETTFILTYVSSGVVITKTSTDGKTFA